MDSHTEDMCFDKLEELIQDEEKIVTCVLVSRELNISIRDAGCLLKKYVNKLKQHKPKSIRVTYLLAGALKDHAEAIYLVKDEDIDKAKSEFETITSEVVYSVQKGGNIDFSAINLVDVGQVRDKPLIGSVVGKNCTLRKIIKEELPAPSSQKIEHKKGTIKSLFSQGNKSNDKPNNKPLPVGNQTAKGKTNGNIANFFKTSNNVQKENKKDEEKPLVQKENVEEKKMDIDDSPKKPTKETNKKRKTQNNENQANKRRKRIAEICDSDSSDIFENDEDGENAIGPSDDEPPPPPPPQPKVTMKPLTPKNKRKKAVTKTYKDEEGYLVTKTEYIFESASDNDEPPIERKKIEEKPKIAKKSSTDDSECDLNVKNKGKGNKNSKKPTTGKQQTLMNFFTKK